VLPRAVCSHEIDISVAGVGNVIMNSMFTRVGYQGYDTAVYRARYVSNTDRALLLGIVGIVYTEAACHTK
jgi:hypothetical protein